MPFYATEPQRKKIPLVTSRIPNLPQSCNEKLKAVLMHATKDHVYVVTWSEMWYIFVCTFWWFMKRNYLILAVPGMRCNASRKPPSRSTSHEVR
jgi:hypothetical protein